MATRAPLADADRCACLTRVVCDHRSQVQKSRSADTHSSDRGIHIRSDLVTPATNGGTEMDQHIAGAQAATRELRQPAADDSGRGPFPTAVKHRAKSRRM